MSIPYNFEHNYKFCSSLPSTQLFIVGANSKIRTNVLRIDIMLSGKMGHQNQVIVYISLVSFFVWGMMRGKEEEGRASEQVIIFTRVTQRSFSREYHGPALLFYPNGVTCAVRFEFTLQLS
jgi:hypothetical protein